MSSCQVTGESCPQCAQADLQSYGNGSKWICPRCFFILPCCEGGAAGGSAAGAGGATVAGGAAAARGEPTTTRPRSGHAG